MNKHKGERKSIVSECKVFGNKCQENAKVLQVTVKFLGTNVKGKAKVLRTHGNFFREIQEFCKGMQSDFNKRKGERKCKVLQTNVKCYAKKCEQTKFCNLT